MRPLKPEDRALFTAGRRALGPRDEDRARMAKALGLKVGVATAAVGATAKGAASVGGTALAKWAFVCAVAATVGTGGVAVYRAQSRGLRTEPTLTAQRNEPHVHAVFPAPAVLGAPSTPVAPLPSPSATDAPARIEATPRRAPSPAARGPRASTVQSSAPPVASASVAPPLPSVAPPSVDVADEARLLREADAALRAGDSARAEAFLDEHARRFPEGVLAEERDAELVLVQCAAGQAERARTSESRFLREHPRSLLAGRVKGSCGGR